MLTTLDWFGRRCLAWPLAILGSIGTDISGWLLRAAAWLVEYDLSELD